MKRTIVLETRGFCDLFAKARGEEPSPGHIQKVQRVLAAWGFKDLRLTLVTQGALANSGWWKAELVPGEEKDQRLEYVILDITLRATPKGEVIYSSYRETAVDNAVVTFPEVLQWTPFAPVTEINYLVQRVNVTE